jgi:hypothetical protein
LIALILTILALSALGAYSYRKKQLTT